MANTKGKTVRVNLKRSWGYEGTLYGPGEGIEVPEGLATALGLDREPVAPAEPASGTSVGADVPADAGDVGQEADTESRSEYQAQDVEDLEKLAQRRKLSVQGTGSGGRVLKRDLVEALAKSDAEKAKGGK